MNIDIDEISLLSGEMLPDGISCNSIQYLNFIIIMMENFLILINVYLMYKIIIKYNIGSVYDDYNNCKNQILTSITILFFLIINQNINSIIF